jgi:hypothetical protein
VHVTTATQLFQLDARKRQFVLPAGGGNSHTSLKNRMETYFEASNWDFFGTE